MSDIIEEFFNFQMSFKNVREVIDRINEERDKLRDLAPKQKEERIKKLSKVIRNEMCNCIHPVVKKMVDWGRLKGRSAYGHDLEEVISELLNKGIRSSEDLRLLRRKIKNFKRGMMRDVERIIRGL